MAILTRGELKEISRKHTIDELSKLIDKFKAQEDVISGKAFAFDKTTYPNGWGEAITTTGYCVKVSDVFWHRMLKNFVYSNVANQYNPYSNSKLISIEIDSNLFGRCNDGSHNAWHTAIDLKLHGEDNYILDLTCGQFGSEYHDKWFWDKNEWLDTFQTKTPKMIRYIKFKSLSEKLMEKL